SGGHIRRLSGTATMTGQANLTANTENNQTIIMTNGTVQLTATFGSATPHVDMSMSGFTNTDATGVAVSDVPFTGLTITDMGISGNGFSGGTATFTTPTLNTTPLGTGQTTAVQGTFFGLTADTGQPYEAGGVLLVQGSTGKVTGVFVASQ
ncbi:MAG: hypothetical protein AAF701_02225, partial [Pseudomonadota bacterium]